MTNERPSKLKIAIAVHGRFEAFDFTRELLKRGIDDFNREALHIEVDTTLPVAQVICALEQVADERGYPQAIRSDNGPEFLAQALAAWTVDRQLL